MLNIWQSAMKSSEAAKPYYNKVYNNKQFFIDAFRIMTQL